MSATSVTPLVEGWFTTGDEPRLLASRCTTCSNVVFPPVSSDAGAAAFYCRNPACDGEEHDSVELSRRGTVWSYTDAQYQPPAPYVPASDPYQPFALAAVELELSQPATSLAVTPGMGRNAWWYGMPTKRDSARTASSSSYGGDVTQPPSSAGRSADGCRDERRTRRMAARHARSRRAHPVR